MKELFIVFIAFLLLEATVKAQSNRRTNTSSQKVNPKPVNKTKLDDLKNPFDTAKVKAKSPRTAQVNNNNKPATNAVDSHDKYANQEVSYSTGNNKTKTNTKPAPSSKTGKTKLMEEEGIYYRRRH